MNRYRGGCGAAFLPVPVCLAAFAFGADPAQAQTVSDVVSSAGAVRGLTLPVPHEIGFIFNTFLFLVAGFMVMYMACGFAMLEAGMVRTKNVTMQLTKNMGLFSVAAIFYYLIGYRLMYPGDEWLIEGVLGVFGPTTLEPVALDGVLPDYAYASVGSDFFFQLMFCVTTASIVSGTLAERIKLWPFLVFTVILTSVVYPIQASWKWGGGWLGDESANGFMMVNFGHVFQDFAGSTVVHSVGGWAALAGAIVLGPRIGKYNRDGSINPMPGSNLALATLGTFILWFGWFGFNGGSQLYMNTAGDVADISRILVNTNMAAAGGAFSAFALSQLVYGRPDLTLILNGALAGLVAITAEPLYPDLGGALLVGAGGGVIVVFGVALLDKLRLDDVVGAIPVHLFSGIWGTIAVVFSNPNSAILSQLFAIGAIGCAVFFASLVLWAILRFTIGVRVRADDEIQGLDTAELEMEAYPEFGKGSQFI